MKQSTLRFLKTILPNSASELYRGSREVLRRSLFRPYVATNNYGDMQLQVRIEDPTASKWYDRDWAALSELELLRRGKLKSGARVFDLGSHQCVVAMILARIAGPTGAVIAVDPVPHNISVAIKNRSINHIENLFIRRAAISSSNGKARFSRTTNGRISISGYEVERLSLDALVSEYGKPDVFFRDIEGHEHHALVGGQRTIGLDIDWFIEVHTKCGLEDAGGSVTQIIQRFREADYNLYVKTVDDESAPFTPLTYLPTDRFFMVASRFKLL